MLIYETKFISAQSHAANADVLDQSALYSAAALG
jgi:hypothetical protein